MNGNCHCMFGAAVGTAIAININKVAESFPNIHATSEFSTLFILGGILGGVLPDIDNPVSHVGRLTAPISNFIAAIGNLAGRGYVKHRGIMHDPLIYIAGLIVSYLYFPPLVCLLVGCLSHIYLDLFNPSGVPFAFGIRRWRLGTITSGSHASKILTWVHVLFIIVVSFAFKVGVFQGLYRVTYISFP